VGRPDSHSDAADGGVSEPRRDSQDGNPVPGRAGVPFSGPAAGGLNKADQYGISPGHPGVASGNPWSTGGQAPSRVPASDPQLSPLSWGNPQQTRWRGADGEDRQMQPQGPGRESAEPASWAQGRPDADEQPWGQQPPAQPPQVPDRRQPPSQPPGEPHPAQQPGRPGAAPSRRPDGTWPGGTQPQPPSPARPGAAQPPQPGAARSSGVYS
jgi:hypothetical protein